MFIYRHYSKIALILVLLLAWTQQLVAAHGVVHPFQDGGAQHHAPGTDKPLCDLCVISALDNMPTVLPDFNLATDAGHVSAGQPDSVYLRFLFFSRPTCFYLTV
jgi:hypothetical protein